MQKSLCYLLVSLSALPGLSTAVTVTIHWSTDVRMVDFGSSPLGPGTSADGDGTLIQLGYFANGTPASPISGSWIVIATGSVGDQGVDLPGFFSITTILASGSFLEPAVGTPLGVRFFDSTVVGTSSFYNTAVNGDGSGLWVSPGEPSPVITLILSKAASVLENGGGFRTDIPVPEPGTLTLLCIATSLFLRRRRPT